jgi:hypothetical protein
LGLFVWIETVLYHSPFQRKNRSQPSRLNRSRKQASFFCARPAVVKEWKRSNFSCITSERVLVIVSGITTFALRSAENTHAEKNLINPLTQLDGSSLFIIAIAGISLADFSSELPVNKLQRLPACVSLQANNKEANGYELQ